MAGGKSKQPASERSSIAIAVDGYQAEVGMSLNIFIGVGDPRWFERDDLVFPPDVVIEITGTCLYPGRQAGDQYKLSFHGKRDTDWPLSATAADSEKRDERGHPVYRKRRGERVPVYATPPGITTIERERGTKCWKAYVPMRYPLLSDMLTLLSRHEPLYVELRVHKVERRRWIEGVSLVTQEPNEENHL